jgi:hypothetical protein
MQNVKLLICEDINSLLYIKLSKNIFKGDYKIIYDLSFFWSLAHADISVPR